MSFFSFSTTVFAEQFLPSYKRKPKQTAWVRVLLSGVQYVRDKFFNFYAEGFTGDSVESYNAAKTYAVEDMVFYNGVIYSCTVISTGNLPTDISFFAIKAFELGDVIKYADKGVYYSIGDNSGGVAPVDATYWEKLQNNFIGLDERIQITSQVIKYEYILNKWFGTSYNYPTSTNDVFITNNVTNVNSFIYGVDANDSSAHYLTDATQIDVINIGFTATDYDFNINIPTATYDGLSPNEPTGITATKTAIVRSFADEYNIAGITYNVVIY